VGQEGLIAPHMYSADWIGTTPASAECAMVCPGRTIVSLQRFVRTIGPTAALPEILRRTERWEPNGTMASKGRPDDISDRGGNFQ
jgi:hypothetical protein